MLYDIFILYGNLDLIDLRINILKDVVDKFIIIELNKSINNTKKDLIYQEYKKSLSEEMKNKIIYIPITNLDFFDKNDYYNKQFNVVKNMNLNIDDQLLFSDEPAIPNPKIISYYQKNNEHIAKVFKENVYEYYLNSIVYPSEKWGGTIMIRFDKFSKIENNFRDIIFNDPNTIFIEDAGWYFSGLLYSKNYNTKNIDIFSSDLPDYLKNNSRKYQKYICPTQDNYLKINNYFNFQPLYDFVADFYDEKSKIVELGCFYGSSIIYLASNFKKQRKSVIIDAVDKWDFKLENVFDKFIENINNNYVADMINVMHYDSIEASKKYDNNSIDFIFIDANHEYESVKSDIEAWYPKLKENGIMAGHDIQQEGVFKALNDFYDKNKEEIEITIINEITCWLLKKKNNNINFDNIKQYIYKFYSYNPNSTIYDKQIFGGLSFKINVRPLIFAHHIIKDVKEILYQTQYLDSHYLYYRNNDDVIKLLQYNYYNNIIDIIKFEELKDIFYQAKFFYDYSDNLMKIITIEKEKIKVYYSNNYIDFFVQQELKIEKKETLTIHKIAYDFKKLLYFIYYQLNNKEIINKCFSNFDDLLNFLIK